MAQPYDDDDEDLRRAIAMSLEDAESSAVYDSTPQASMVAVNGKAMNPASQLQDHEVNQAQSSTALQSSQPTPARSNSDAPRHPSGMSGVLGLDRKAMEQERLARLATRKRQAPISPPPVARDDKHASKKARIELAQHKEQTTSSNANGTPTLRFPRGFVKKTYSAAHPEDQGIKIEDILDKKNVKTAILSSFLLDADWIFGKFNIHTTKFYMILHAKEERTRAVLREDFAGVKTAKLCLPELKGAYSSMHSKLMLLFFADFMRIVVPTANLTNYDWGETGVMENTVFLLDLPRRMDGKGSEDDLTNFGKELLFFLRKLGLQEEAIEGTLNFDFSSTNHLAFIHSVVGSHYDDDLQRTGYPGLSNAVRQLGLETRDDVELDLAVSSLGSLDYGFVRRIYEATRGQDVVFNPHLLRSNKSKQLSSKAVRAESLENGTEKVKEHVRIYFPTQQTVQKSVGGADSAGTICLQKKYFDEPGFPRSLLRDHRSTRKGLLSHNKLMLVRGKKDGTAGESIAWAYVGSANLSGSAWGRLVHDKERKTPKLTCSNWECGVVIPVPSPSNLEGLSTTFNSVVDVPFEPGEEYNGRTPWFYQGHHS